jgi:uncharacterized membrane protein YgcG
MLIAALVATSIAPSWARAQDWDDQGEGYDDGWADERPPDYDVSVDVGVSGGVTFDTFYAPLGAHGEWVSAGAYGRVWRPHVAAGWRPYYYGRWEWTNEGWFWVSDEPWGWAAYHYGRWAFDGVYGWVWIPGYQWAPAWVSWRWSGDVVGWAPLAPGLSVYVSSYPYYDAWWTFVPCASFVSVPVYSVAYAPRYTRHYFDQTTAAPARPAPRPISGHARPAPAASPAWGGPAPRAIEARIGRALRPSRVVAAPSPAAARAGSGEIAVFRPGSRPAPDRGRPDAPGRLEDRGRAASPRFPERDDERGNGFAPPGRRGERSDSGSRGWGRPDRVTPSPVQRGERYDAAPSRGGGNESVPRGWSRPQRVEQQGVGAPARAPEARSRSGAERGPAAGGAPGSTGHGGGRGGSGDESRGGGGGGQATARGAQQQGGGRPAPANPHR